LKEHYSEINHRNMGHRSSEETILPSELAPIGYRKQATTIPANTAPAYSHQLATQPNTASLGD